MDYSNETGTITQVAKAGNVKVNVAVASSTINGTYSLLKIENGQKFFNSISVTSQENFLEKEGMVGAEFGVGLKIGFGINWNQLAGSFKHF